MHNFTLKYMGKKYTCGACYILHTIWTWTGCQMNGRMDGKTDNARTHTTWLNSTTQRNDT